MTAMEEWVLKNSIPIGLVLLGGIMAFIKLRAWSETVGKKVDADIVKLDHHLASDLPHISCQVEKERYSSISDRLGRIEDKIETVDDRVVQLLRGRDNRE